MNFLNKNIIKLVFALIAFCFPGLVSADVFGSDSKTNVQMNFDSPAWKAALEANSGIKAWLGSDGFKHYIDEKGRPHRVNGDNFDFYEVNGAEHCRTPSGVIFWTKPDGKQRRIIASQPSELSKIKRWMVEGCDYWLDEFNRVSWIDSNGIEHYEDKYGNDHWTDKAGVKHYKDQENCEHIMVKDGSEHIKIGELEFWNENNFIHMKDPDGNESQTTLAGFLELAGKRLEQVIREQNQESE